MNLTEGINKNISDSNGYSCMADPLYRNSLLTLFIVTVFLSIVLNVLVWIAFGVNTALRTHANLYLLSLSVSDFITATSIGWIEIYYIWEFPYWFFGEKGTFAQNAFWCLSLVTPFMHTIIISLDRFLAVVRPTNYHKHKSMKRVLLKLFVVWMYSFLSTSVMVVYFTPAPGYEYQWNVLAEWYYPFIGLHIAMPLLICSFLYYFILKKILCSKRALAHNPKPVLWREYTYTRTIALLVLLLYCVWLPVIGMEVVYAVMAHTCVVAQLGTISVWLTCTSGVINPAILLTRNPSFRKTLLSKIFNFGCYGNKQNNSSIMTLKITAGSSSEQNRSPSLQKQKSVSAEIS